MIKQLKKLLIPLFLRTQSPENVFTRIYRRNSWGDAESVSGPGSNLQATAKLRDDLVEFFKKHAIKTILDVPCGDYHWFKEIPYEFELYTGYDIVKPLVHSNAGRYGTHKIRFRHCNAVTDKIEDADLIFCRDFLIHLSEDDIFSFFSNLRRANVPTILVSDYAGTKNRDIATGDCRSVNLTADPYNFPAPLEVIDETGQMSENPASRKTLSYWKTDDIFAALDANIHYQKLAKKAA